MRHKVSINQICRILEWTIFLVGLTLAVIKALLAPFSFDEALSYNAFATQSYYTIFTVYDTNNHLVNTLGMKAMLALFGDGEFALRIPALLGRILFLGGTIFITREIFRHPINRTTCLLTLALHPLLLDFGACARGYGIGLGFSMLGLWLAIKVYTNQTVFTSLPGKTSWWSQILFSIIWGMAIISVPIYSNLYIPLFILIIGKIYLKARKNDPLKALILTVNTGLRMGLPATILFILMYNGFFNSMSYNHFYVGESSIWASIRSITRTFVYWNCIEDFPNPTGLIGTAWKLSLHPVSSLLMLLVTIAGLSRWKTKTARVILTALFGAICIVFIEHMIFALPYPTERTGIYFIPLATIMCFFLTEKLYITIPGKVARYILPAPFLIIIFFQMSIWNFHQHLPYWNTAGSGPAMRFIQSQIEKQHEVNALPKESVVIYPSWCLSPTQDYYRQRLNMPYVKKLGWPDNLQLPEGGNYYITVSGYSLFPKETKLTGPIFEIPELKTKIYKGKDF